MQNPADSTYLEWLAYTSLTPMQVNQVELLYQRIMEGLETGDLGDLPIVPRMTPEPEG